MNFDDFFLRHIIARIRPLFTIEFIKNIINSIVKDTEMPKQRRPKSIDRTPHAIKKFLVDKAPKHPRDLVQVAMVRFNLTRPAVHRHLEKLISDGSILKAGSRNTTVYKLPNTKSGTTWSLNLGKDGNEGRIWQRDFAPKVASYSKNIQDIGKA